MNIYILTDLEGVCGVYSFEQTRDCEYGDAMHAEVRRLLMGEVNAAVAGAFDAGAERVVVRDGHDGAKTFVLEDLDERAEAIMGRHEPLGLVLNDGFDGAFLLGYHAMSNTERAVLCHTQSSRTWDNYWINGHLAGEIEQCAILLGAHNIPVAMVTGDDRTATEAKWVLGNRIVTVEVKRGLGRESALMVAPKRARKMIYDGAREAIRRLPKIKPLKPRFPLKVRWQFKDPDIVTHYEGAATKVDERTLEKKATSAEEIFRP